MAVGDAAPNGSGGTNSGGGSSAAALLLSRFVGACMIMFCVCARAHACGGFILRWYVGWYVIRPLPYISIPATRCPPHLASTRSDYPVAGRYRVQSSQLLQFTVCVKYQLTSTAAAFAAARILVWFSFAAWISAFFCAL